MKRVYVVSIVITVFLVGYITLTTSESAAEPILGMESLDVPTDNAPEKRPTADALALFQARDFAGSLKLWQEAARKNPDLPPAQTIMAQLFSRANMPQEAKNALKQAIDDAPDDPEAYTLLAQIHLRDRNLGEAESLLEKAGGLLPTFDKSAKRKELLQAQLLGGQAVLAEAHGDWAAAEQSYEALLELNPKNVAALRRIGYCLYRQNKIEDAMEKLREIPKIIPEYLAPEAILAQFYEQSGDRENADRWMASAVAAAPENLRTRLLAGKKALEAKRYDEARKHAIAATRIDQTSIDAKLLQGMLATFEENYMAAELFFSTALKQYPDHLGLNNNLALVLIEQDNEAKSRLALEYAEANVKRYPKSPIVASTYGYVLYRLGRLDDAEQALRAAAPIASTDVDTAYVLACLAADRGRKDEARQLLETGLKSKNMSMFREEAEELLEELKK